VRERVLSVRVYVYMYVTNFSS